MQAIKYLRSSVHVYSAASILRVVEPDRAVYKGVECVVTSNSNIISGSEASTALPHDDGASGNSLTTERFHAEAFACAVTAIAGGSATFFMCHVLPLLNIGAVEDSTTCL